MHRHHTRSARSVPVSTPAQLDAHSKASIATKPAIAEESPCTPCPKEMSTTSTWRSRIGSARGKHAPKSTVGAKTGIIEFWAEVWTSGGDDDMLPPLHEHKPPEILSVGLGPEDGGAAHEVSLADLIKPARSQRKPGKANDFEIVPRVREVIALDDHNEGPEPDEAWEVVSSDGEDDERSVLSYADIVANKAV